MLTTEVRQEMPYGQEPVRLESQGMHRTYQLPVLKGPEMLLRICKQTMHCSYAVERRQQV